MSLRSAVLWTFGALAGATVLLAWLLSSPPGSSPDDGYHLSSIWCARGFDPDRCIDASPPGSQRSTGVVIVPAATQAVTCMAGQSTEPASCVYDALALGPDRLATVSGGNVGGERAGIYYRAVSVFVSDDYPRAFFLIRLSNIAVALIGIMLTLAVAPPAVRGAVATTWVVTTVPLGLFLVTSLNSSAWGFVGLTLFWANALTILRTDDRHRRIAAGVLLVVGATMALGARTEALGHLLFATVALLFLGLERGPSLARTWRRLPVAGRRRTILLSLTITIVSVLALRSLAPLDYLRGTLSGTSAGYERLVLGGRSQPLLPLLTELPLLWTGSFGDRFGLGWLDTAMPIIVYVLVLTCFAALLGIGLQGASAWRVAAFGTTVVALFVLPTFTLLSIGAPVGESYQPRHYLPSLMLLLGLALVGSHDRPRVGLARGGVVGISLAMGVAHAVALHTNIRRYTTGLRMDMRLDLNESVGWWWAHGPSPMLTWVLGSIAFTLLAAAALSLLSGRTATATTQPSPSR